MREPIRVAVVGVGNCASALVQGVSYYATERPGTITWDIHGYHPADIAFSAGFDVNAEKVGLKLDQAIFASCNNTIKFSEVPEGDAMVHPAPALDGLGSKYREKITATEQNISADQVVAILKKTRTQIIVNYLPVGSKAASEWWAERALEAHCGFINCIPEIIANNPTISSRFRTAQLPLFGDDVKSQVGATIVHRTLVRLMRERGISVDRTYQLNFGGNMDFYNMLNAERLGTKRVSKTNAVKAEMGDVPARNIHIGPSDFVEWLDDRKWCHIRIEGKAFGGTPINLELKLEVWDSPNSAGVVMDLIRWCRVAIERGERGVIEPPCAVYMKYPPVQKPENEAGDWLVAWSTGSQTQ